MVNLAEQFKNDPATVEVSVQTIYGSFHFRRAFPTNWPGFSAVSSTPLNVLRARLSQPENPAP